MVAQENSKSSRDWMAPFFLIWSGQAMSLLGSQLVQFALIWWLTQTTGSATVLATAVLVGLLPQIVLGPLAGAIVDRWNRRMLMMLADSLVAMATVGLAVLFWTGLVQIWHVYALMLLRSAFGLFHWSAMQASTSLMVPKEHLSRIQGLNQVLNGVMNIGAAPLGALLLVWLPMQGILAIDIVTAAIAVACLFFVAIPQPERHLSTQPGEGQTGLWQDVRDGLRYVWAWPGLMLIAGLATLINLVLNPDQCAAAAAGHQPLPRAGVPPGLDGIGLGHRRGGRRADAERLGRVPPPGTHLAGGDYRVGCRDRRAGFDPGFRFSGGGGCIIRGRFHRTDDRWAAVRGAAVGGGAGDAGEGLPAGGQHGKSDLAARADYRRTAGG